MISAMAAGPSLTVLVSMLAARLAPRYANVSDDLLEKLSHFIGWVLVAYLYFRFWDAMSMTYTMLPGRTEGLSFLTNGPFSFNFWVGEILLGALVPIVILLVGRFRRQPALRMLALALVVGGLVAYRWDVNLSGQLVLLGYLPQDITARYTTYIPSMIEMITGLGIIAFGIFAVSFGVRYLNIVNHGVVEEDAQAPVSDAVPVGAD
jgi:molybdopterin-containing oxidoreductase family membrane subunit